MPSPAADAPFPERAFNVTALKWNTCAWLLLPVLVFMAWWMHWYVSIPLAALMAAGLAPGRRKELPERESLPSFPLFNRSSFLVLGAFIALMVLSGWGEWVNQHPDHIVRNACLRELVASPWPVVFPDGDVLIYNTGFWLVPALAGKVAGLEVARAFVVLWGAWGLFLAWLWLCVFSGRRSLLLALLMVMFGSLLNFQCWLGLDLFRLHYFGTAEQVMCSANASIPVMLFFIFLASGRMPPHWMPLLFAATAFYSPLAALGGLPLAVCQWLRQWKGSRSPRRSLLHPSFPAAVMLGAWFLLYYAAVNAPSSHIRGRGIFCWQGPPSCCTPCSAGGISGGIPSLSVRWQPDCCCPSFTSTETSTTCSARGAFRRWPACSPFWPSPGRGIPVSGYGYGFCWRSDWRPGSMFPITAVLPAPSRHF